MGTLVENEVFLARRSWAGQVGAMQGKAWLDVCGVLQHVMMVRTSWIRRETFWLRLHTEKGESFAALGLLCTILHTLVRSAIARAAQRREESLR